MSYGHAILCSFDAVSHIRGKARTYENIKKAVLEAGQFSCFDVVTRKDARIFTDLCHDPELEIDHTNFHYPWTGVKLKTHPVMSSPIAGLADAVEQRKGERK